MRVAFQQSILHKDLPKEQQIKESEVRTARSNLQSDLQLTSQDVPYLTPIIKDIMKEDAERAHWDSIIVERKK
jgi:ubiquinol-cytochrome c reductase subunit 7